MSTTNPTASGRERLGPYSEQLPFLSPEKRYHAFVSGIGAGKTVAGILRVLKNVRDWNSGETGYIIAPTVPSLRNVIIPELDKWGVLGKCEYNRSENHLTFPNGSKVILESADNDRKIQRLRGPSIAWFWMDEAATIDRRAWDVMIGRLRAGEYRNAFVTTTPSGYNWVYERFAEADDVNRVFNVPTTANPHLPDDYKEEIIEEYDGQFYEQEVKGQFTRFEGLIYDWFGDDHITDTLPDTDRLERVIYGVDWGFHDPAILAIGKHGGDWVVLEDHKGTGATVANLLRSAKDIQERWKPGTFYCDPAEPSNIEQFKRSGLDARAAENDVLPGIQKVTSLRDRLQVHESCQHLRNEMRQYQWKEGDDGETDTPVKKNDHCCDCLRYALFTHDTTPRKATRHRSESAGRRTITRRKS